MKNKAIGWVLLIWLLIRALLAIFIELNNDEVYYWTYPQHLQWNYFDHPPGIAILLKIFTANLTFQQAFFLRLGPMFCSALSCLLVYNIAKKVKNEWAGWLAAMLFVASPYCSFIAGWLVMPDAPQLVCWLFSIWLMLRVIDSNADEIRLRNNLLLLGFAIGCCMLCKVHGVFLWAGFFGYIIFFQRRLLKNPFLWLGVFLGALVFSPVLFWNIANDFASYRFHSNRVSFFGALQPDNFLTEIIGELLYNNPVVFIGIVIMVIAIARRQNFTSSPAQRLLLFLSLPLIGLVWLMSLFRDTLPHWTGPAYTGLLPLLAAWLAQKKESEQKFIFPLPVKMALGLILILLLPAFVLIKWLPVNTGNKEHLHLGEGDPLLDMSGFSSFGQQFDSLYQKDRQQDSIGQNAILMTDNWFPAAHIDYYVAKPASLKFIAAGESNRLHHYAWLNELHSSIKKGDDAYYITVSNLYRPPSAKLLQQFEHTSTPVTITQYRGGIAVRNFFVYRLKHCRGFFPHNGIIE